MRGKKISPYQLIPMVITIGIFLRFSNLSHIAYWGDEVVTSLRVSGYTVTEMVQNVQTGQLITVEEFTKYQKLHPNRGVTHTITSLIKEDSQHPPLYYSLAHFWTKLLGDSSGKIRLLSVLASLLVLPCIYWFCYELFENKQVGYIATGLAAISPVHILYAQEARQYSLWMLLILVSSATLLKCLRLGRDKGAGVNWVIYGVSVGLSLYTHLFTLPIIISHAIYVAIIEKLKLTRTVLFYLASLCGSVFLFSPWILVLLNTPPKSSTVSWMDQHSSQLSTLVRWTGLLSRSFFDIGVGPSDSLTKTLVASPFILLVIFVIFYSLYHLFRNTNKKAWLLIFLLISVNALPIFLSDLIFSRRQGTTRFILPTILAIQVSVSYLFYSFRSIISNKGFKNFLQGCMVLFIFSGVLFGFLYSSSYIWWNKGPEVNTYNREIASIINKADRPLVVSDGNVITMQELARLLDGRVEIQLFNLEEHSLSSASIKPNRNLFLVHASPLFRTKIEKLLSGHSKNIIGPLEQIEISSKRLDSSYQEISQTGV